MRMLDAVVFISDFGKRSAIAECPDLDVERLHVVSCGADPHPLEGNIDEPRRSQLGGRFVACLSSTFWHKNRSHAIATFAAMVERHGYRGSIVITGPEPYFGSSSEAEYELIETLPEHVRGRVHHWGHVDDQTKWWLLRNADLILYPSIVEGFGLVPFEAAAVGTPTLAHAGTAPGELLHGTPAVIDSWAPRTWAERATTLIASDEARHALVGAITDVAARHSWRACAERTWEAVDSTLAAPRRSIHGEDGGGLAQIAKRGTAHPLAAQLRFDVARGVPAAVRRIRRLRWRGVTR
jgi:glycosyltransferase involved in cell wall biosynthesis